MGASMDHDIIIAGGGPAGLAFARSLASSGLNLALIERQDEAALADPRYDGREIALTHASVRILRELVAWARIPANEVSMLRAADVLNGNSPLALTFDAGSRRPDGLGCLVSNHHIRRSLFECVAQQPNAELFAGVAVDRVSVGASGAEAVMADGRQLRARLLVAADSRFSAIRDQLGIAAQMNRLGTAMLVCRVAHEREHRHVATEWFGDGYTIAMLPLNGRMSSAVLTLPLAEAERLAAMGDERLGVEIASRYRHRLGSMRVASSRHLYPLVTSWARRFAVPRAALIGDAAVGMHPVTAHGFNLGVSGQARLADEILKAIRSGRDWAGERVLRRYDVGHRRASRPLFAATNFIVGLYGDHRPRAGLARHAGIRLARRLPLFRTAISRGLLHA
jgi:ubiquinone biosynthesis UbiH/UbiF/VisC/COQ6 family hydroxylase